MAGTDHSPRPPRRRRLPCPLPGGFHTCKAMRARCPSPTASSTSSFRTPSSSTLVDASASGSSSSRRRESGAASSSRRRIGASPSRCTRGFPSSTGFRTRWAHPVYREDDRVVATEVHLLTRRRLRGPLSGARPHRRSRHDAGGGRRLARARSTGIVIGDPRRRARPAQRGDGAAVWDLGVRGTTLDVVAAWKEALLLVALIVRRVARAALPGGQGGRRARDDVRRGDRRVLGDPAGVLGGEATARGELLALRHHLHPVAAYALGRLAAFRVGGTRPGRRLDRDVGLSSWRWSGFRQTLAFISLQAWRDSGVPGWYREQLDLIGTSASPGCPRTGSRTRETRTTRSGGSVSTFLSPLASAYALVVALIYVVSRPFRWWWGGLLGLLLYVALLFTHTRVALAALAVRSRRARPRATPDRCRRCSPLFASSAIGALFLFTTSSIGPSTSYTSEELRWLRENAREEGGDGARHPFSEAERCRRRATGGTCGTGSGS